MTLRLLTFVNISFLLDKIKQGDRRCDITKLWRSYAENTGLILGATENAAVKNVASESSCGKRESS